MATSAGLLQCTQCIYAHLCPSCQHSQETPQQFLACPNSDHQPVWKDLHQLLQKRYQNMKYASLHDTSTLAYAPKNVQWTCICFCCPHAHNDTLWSAILNKGWMVSNAAVHPSGYGSCARTIWSGIKLWSGEGYTPSSLPSDLYSGLAEAYGIYTVLSFLITYISMYPVIIPHWPPISIYCDNQGLVDCLNQHTTCVTQSAKCWDTPGHHFTPTPLINVIHVKATKMQANPRTNSSPSPNI